MVPHPLSVLLAVALPLAAQPAVLSRPDPPEAERKDEGERETPAQRFRFGSHLTVRSGDLLLVLEEARYGLFHAGAKVQAQREGAGPLVLLDAAGRATSLRATGKDEAATWKAVLAHPAWGGFGDRLVAEDLLALKARLEAVGADCTRKGQRPFWAPWTAQAVADLAWMAQGARGKALEKVQGDPRAWDASVPVLQVEVYRRGAVCLRLAMDATGVSAARADCAFGTGDLVLQKTREGQAIRTQVGFQAGQGPSGQFEWLGPWALDPVQTYPEFLEACAGAAFAAEDLAAARTLVAQCLADGPRSPLLREPLLKALLANLDALAERVPASAPAALAAAEPPEASGAERKAPDTPARGLPARFQTFKAGRLSLGLDQAGYSLLDPLGFQEVNRLVAGRLALASEGGRWTFGMRGDKDEAAFWKQVLEHPSGRACAAALPAEDLKDLRAQVEARLYTGMRQSPKPAWVLAAGRAWADLGRLLSVEAPQAAPTPVQVDTGQGSDRPVLPSPVASAEPVLPAPAAPVLEEKTPVERAVTWSAESRLGYRIEVRPSGYDLRLGGLRLVFALGGSGRDAWVTFTVSDGKGHAYTRTRTFHARAPRASEDVLGALAEEHYDAFELMPLIEAWREGGEDWMRPHAGLRALDDLETVLLDRLEATAAVEPRPADLAATFLATMEVSRFAQHVIEALAGPVD